MARRKQLFDPALPFPLRLSRRVMELYQACPRCFYNEVRQGIKRPSMPAFTLNKAVDTLLKREFDRYRKLQQPHPLFKEQGIDVVPYDGPEMDTWRSVQKGVKVFLEEQNVEIGGAIDDVMCTKKGRLEVVDYKATSKKEDVSGIGLAGMYADSYIRQLSWYAYLIQQSGHKVSKTGYLLVANAEKEKRRGFSASLSFAMHLVPVSLNFSWITPLIEEIYTCASQPEAPTASDRCEHCVFAARSGADEKSYIPPHLGSKVT